MYLYLDEQIKKYFSTSQPLFDQLMALQGECFRQQKGRITQRVKIGDKYYFIKQHHGVGIKEIVKNLLQLRLPVLSAKNEWIAIRKLQSLNVAVAPIVAFGYRGINPASLQSFILMEELSPTVSLEELCKTWRETKPSFNWKRMLIEKVAQIASVLHQHGMNHRDFYICHFLFDLSQTMAAITADNLRLYLIDLHRAQNRGLTPERWTIKDLSGLYFSSKEIGLTERDYYRFMKIYRQKSLREIVMMEHYFWQKVKKRGEQLYRDHTKS